MATPPQLSFASVEDLSHCLSQYQIDPSRWKGSSVAYLFQEVTTGECILELKNGKLHRKVNVVSVHCFHTNHNQEKFRLIEEKQILEGGEERKRGYQFVSETMKKDENPSEAAVRALAEELSINDPELKFEATPDLDELKTKESSTYVGMECTYHVRHFKTEIPIRLFKQRYVEVEAGTATHFTWVKV